MENASGIVNRLTNNELVRYLIASGIAFMVDFGLLYFLTEKIGLYYMHSAFIGFVMGVICIYLLSIYWVFKQRRYKSKKIEIPVFVVIGVVGLLINQVGLYLVTELYGVYYMLSKMIVMLVVFSWNYLARKNMLFVTKHG